MHFNPYNLQWQKFEIRKIKEWKNVTKPSFTWSKFPTEFTINRKNFRVMWHETWLLGSLRYLNK